MSKQFTVRTRDVSCKLVLMELRLWFAVKSLNVVNDEELG